MSVKRKITWISLVILVIFIKIFSRYPAAVEKFYARGFYLPVSRLQRILFGWIPFSLGDLFYGFIMVWLLYKLVSVIRRLISGQAGKDWLLSLLRRVVFACLWIYVLFNLLWGLNYDRQGIATQLQLDVKPYSTAELTTLLGRIVSRLNELDSLSHLNRPRLAAPSALYSGAIRSYDSLAARDSRFAYQDHSVKSSLFSRPGAWIGFAGYYNPFSGEAQVNTALPLFSQPFTACHEMGHQLGYAKENEANFAGYLAATVSPDPAFRYSVYCDLYLFAARELVLRDTSLVKGFRDALRPGIRADFREMQRFNRDHANPLEPVIWKLYGKYLRANRQPKGIVTYSEVTAWLIAYAKKNGWEKI